MNKRRIYLYFVLLILIFIAWVFTDSPKSINEEPETIKIALREVGHQLLLANQDSTSLVLPVVKIAASKYKMSFQKQLSIEPDSLVAIVKRSFQKAELPEYYIVEVIECLVKEVTYSYKMRNEEDKSIVPCRGRNLPKSCYTIETHFLDKTMFSFGRKFFFFMISLVVIIFFLDILNKKQIKISNENSQNHTSIGLFVFYPDQNKLVKEKIEIVLSKKECELLAIFVKKPNQVIKREELTKKVWEDNGVIVGRSLDTYISKLRKKLKSDNSIKLVNIHGVGYRLELND